MDGLQVANASHEKQAIPGRETDKFPHSQTYAYPPANAQPLAPNYQQHAPPQPSYSEKPLPPDARYRIPFGLSVIAYSVLVATIILIICSAGFGGALGAVAASKGKDCSTAAASTQPSATTTTTTTVFSTVTATGIPTSTPSAVSSSLVANYVPLAPSEIGTAALNCTTGSSVFTPSGSQFQLNCDTNYAGNDIFLVTTYRLADCVGACANLNTLTGTTSCLGVEFNANMEAVVGKNGGNCWLKSAMVDSGPDGVPPSVGAVLVASS